MAEEELKILENTPEEEIQKYFNQVIQCVENRRKALLTKCRKIHFGKKSTTKSDFKNQNDLKFDFNQNLRENSIQDSRRIMESVVSNQLQEVKVPDREIRVRFHGDINHMESVISNLGEVIEEDLPSRSSYDNIETVIAVGKNGTSGNENFSPNGVTFNTETNQILVAQADGQSLACISIFTEDGVYLESLESKHLVYPYGLCTYKDNLYVTDFVEHTVVHFEYIENQYIYANKSDRNVHAKKLFKYPGQFDISKQEELYIPDMGNKRIQILDKSLNYQYEITHDALLEPQDVKLTQDEVYVLHENSPHILIFSYSGQMIRSLLTKEQESNISLCQFFCLDVERNIIISDRDANQIKIFTNQGEHNKINEEKDERKKLIQPMGVALTKDTKIIVVSYNTNSGLHILSKPSSQETL